MAEVPGVIRQSRKRAKSGWYETPDGTERLFRPDQGEMLPGTIVSHGGCRLLRFGTVQQLPVMGQRLTEQLEPVVLRLTQQYIQQPRQNRDSLKRRVRNVISGLVKGLGKPHKDLLSPITNPQLSTFCLLTQRVTKVRTDKAGDKARRVGGILLSLIVGTLVKHVLSAGGDVSSVEQLLDRHGLDRQAAKLGETSLFHLCYPIDCDKVVVNDPKLLPCDLVLTPEPMSDPVEQITKQAGNMSVDPDESDDEPIEADGEPVASGTNPVASGDESPASANQPLASDDEPDESDDESDESDDEPAESNDAIQRVDAGGGSGEPANGSDNVERAVDSDSELGQVMTDRTVCPDALDRALSAEMWEAPTLPEAVPPGTARVFSELVKHASPTVPLVLSFEPTDPCIHPRSNLVSPTPVSVDRAAEAAIAVEQADLGRRLVGDPPGDRPVDEPVGDPVDEPVDPMETESLDDAMFAFDMIRNDDRDADTRLIEEGRSVSDMVEESIVDSVLVSAHSPPVRPPPVLSLDGESELTQLDEVIEAIGLWSQQASRIHAQLQQMVSLKRKRAADADAAADAADADASDFTRQCVSPIVSRDGEVRQAKFGAPLDEISLCPL